MQSQAWTPDILGEPYEATNFELSPDDEGPVRATLVRRLAPTPNGGAVLHIHGFADYFFQTVSADFFAERGYDFYALDLRKYGRSLDSHQTPAYVTSLSEHYPELDKAHQLISATGAKVLMSAHSTGALVATMWLEDRRPDVLGAFFNSPWIAMKPDVPNRLLLTPALNCLGALSPSRVLPRGSSGLYAKSLHIDHAGEWAFDPTLKPFASFPVTAGWLRAVRLAQRRIAAGLGLTFPILSISSDRSCAVHGVDDPSLYSSDVVLDVAAMRTMATAISTHSALVQVPGAIHDVTLSRQPARSRVFTELGRWLGAHIEGSLKQ